MASTAPVEAPPLPTTAPQNVSDLASQLQRARGHASWASAILPGAFFLGSGEHASNLDQLREHAIARVLNVADDVPNFHEAAEPRINYLQLHVGDFGSDRGISRVFDTAFSFLVEAEATQQPVLVHWYTLPLTSIVASVEAPDNCSVYYYIQSSLFSSSACAAPLEPIDQPRWSWPTSCIRVAGHCAQRLTLCAANGEEYACKRICVCSYSLMSANWVVRRPSPAMMSLCSSDSTV